MLRDKIIEKYGDFSNNEKKIAKYIVDNYSHILTLSSSDLAKITGVSNATVVRFAKAMGYKGFLSFRNDLKDESLSMRSPYAALKHTPVHFDDQMLHKYFELLNNDITQFANTIDLSIIDEIADNVLSARTVYLYGIGTDMILANYLNNYLPLLGIHSITVCEEGLAMRDKAIMMSKDDFIIMSSFPDIQDDEYWLASYVHEIGAGLALITDSDVTASDLHCDTYIVTKGSLDTFYNSVVISMVLCDILLLKIRERDPERAERYMKKYDSMTIEISNNSRGK